ncbi:NADPH2:quinone reductase [Rhodococcus sp. LBL1]|nr:NADPH2:quinone reductase [Rhodococcus sp. LBL1]MDH6685139.1 NADPH2:quinone reductase [Rhodococcus sp. LBL2]
MKAVRSRIAGGPETLVVEDLPDPEAGTGQVVIDVAGAGLNRADSLQRQGRYHLPPDATDIFGMEVSGIISSLGPGVTSFAIGEPVIALLSSGGYATKVAVDAGQVLRAPGRVSLLEAAGIPEAAATLVANLCMTGRFRPGETVLVHGATGGIGSFGIQLVKALGGRVAVTGSTPAKLMAAKGLGADILIDYTREDFAERMIDEGGADIILDTVGGPYLGQNLLALRTFGRIITIGLQGGSEGALNLALLMKKKASVTGTLLRDRSVEQKAEIMQQTREIVIPLVESGAIATTIDAVFPLSDVADAHRYFDSGAHVGKILLDCTR